MKKHRSEQPIMTAVLFLLRHGLVTFSMESADNYLCRVKPGYTPSSQHEG